MFLIAPAAQELASCDGADGEAKACEAKTNGYFTGMSSRKKGQHEHDTRIKTCFVHLHRQMDTQDFVLAKREALSPRAVAPPAWARFAAHADQDSSQSRIRGLNRQAYNPVEIHHCRVFVDSTGKDNHRSTQRNVSLGTAVPQRRERASTAARSRNRVNAILCCCAVFPTVGDAH